MATELTPTSLLDAVNLLLSTIGETPINSLEGVAFTDASVALDTLTATQREVLTTGFYFNTDDTYTFTPDANGEVIPPPNVLKLRPATDEDRRIVPRGGKLYDRDAQSTVFDADSPPLMYVVWNFDYETLPEAFRWYIAVRSARMFQTKVLGSDQLYAFTEDHEQEARAAMWREQEEYAPANFLNDSQDVQEIWMR